VWSHSEGFNKNPSSRKTNAWTAIPLIRIDAKIAARHFHPGENIPGTNAKPLPHGDAPAGTKLGSTPTLDPRLMIDRSR
jgi:hypothetical protein